MKSRPSVQIAIIFIILLPFVLAMCSNPVIVNLLELDQNESGLEIIPVTDLSLNETTLNLLTSEMEALTAAVQPYDATNKAVTWTSSDDLVAEVSGNGIITAIGAGATTITVTTVDGNHAASCTVTVRQSTGEADAPFLIYNETQLRKVGRGVDGWDINAHYKLMADITVIQGEWTPIGIVPGTVNAYHFKGSFNGNNKTITGLNINNPDADNQGMFRYIGSGGEVKNLTLGNCNVSGKSYTGGVAGGNLGTVENCNVEGVVSGYGILVGGVTGANDGTVDNCYASGHVSGTDRVGGIVGINTGTVEGCYASCGVSGTGYLGGVVGYNSGIVESCYASGDVSGTSNYAGGVAGQNYGGTIANCYATGNVSGYTNAGGVVGQNLLGTGKVENCYASGDIIANNYAGGVAGYDTAGTVKNCVALNPNINSTTPYGRIIGISLGTLTTNYARTDMKVKNGAVTWANNISGKDGEGITAADYQLQSWWSGSAGFDFSATGVWEWHSASRLPVLKGLGTQNSQ
jgi:hypothetical protein